MNSFATRRNWGPDPKYPRVIAYKRPRDHHFKIIAGPCSVESPEQIKTLAQSVALAGATHLRGGLFRAGTYPGSNFGLVDKSIIEAFSSAGRENGLKTVIEVLDYTEYALDRVAKAADVFQVGCRQMQNYTLLRSLGAYHKPVFLKRHPGATIDEWLGAAEHLLASGVEDVTLIERGSSTQARHVRWDLSISIIPAVRALSEIPVVCDPSHGTGRRDLVWSMALAGVAAGAEGVLIETHFDPEHSLSDADQAIHPEEFRRLVERIKRVHGAAIGGYDNS